MKKFISTTVMIAMFTTLAFSQNLPKTARGTIKDTVPDYKLSISTTWLTFGNFGPEETNVYMVEFHFGYKITPKDKIGIKAATWSLFEPMAIPWGPDKMEESESYPGRLRERGIGFTYQRILWKGLFTSVEILPLKKTYLDENKKKIGGGFKLYTSYHLGYHVPCSRIDYLLNLRFIVITGQLTAKGHKVLKRMKINGIKTISSLNQIYL